MAEVRGCAVSEGAGSTRQGGLRQSPATGGIPLAVLGGPLLDPDYELFDLVEQLGGRVVLDATEGGERTLPRRSIRKRVAADPMQELADAYFDTIPDAFRRPNNRLYEWLASELAARQVRGIIFRRYVWCDLWHAELHRLRQWSSLPVLEIDAVREDTGGRTACKAESRHFWRCSDERHAPADYACRVGPAVR